MKWENIKTFNCPHCEAKMYHDGVCIRCISCAFIMNPEKYAKIIERLSHKQSERVTTVFKWQNLKEDKCPMCSSGLFRFTGQYDIMKCLNYDCSFHIREDRLHEILSDPAHPCNKYQVQ